MRTWSLEITCNAINRSSRGLPKIPFVFGKSRGRGYEEEKKKERAGGGRRGGREGREGGGGTGRWKKKKKKENWEGLGRLGIGGCMGLTALFPASNKPSAHASQGK